MPEFVLQLPAATRRARRVLPVGSSGARSFGEIRFDADGELDAASVNLVGLFLGAVSQAPITEWLSPAAEGGQNPEADRRAARRVESAALLARRSIGTNSALSVLFDSITEAVREFSDFERSQGLVLGPGGRGFNAYPDSCLLALGTLRAHVGRVLAQLTSISRAHFPRPGGIAARGEWPRNVYAFVDSERRTGRPSLTVSGVHPAEYYRAAFDRDLRRVIAGTGHPWVRLSVASFCPDWPEVPMYADPAAAFHRLDDSLWFLCGLFVSQLMDQAEHVTMGCVSSVRAGTNGKIVLVGLLGSYWNVMPPTFLLLVASLYRHPVATKVVAAAIANMLRAEIAGLRVGADRRDALLSAARSAVQVAAMPDSLRAFVPGGDHYRWQPDPNVVETLRHSVARVLDGDGCRQGELTLSA